VNRTPSQGHGLQVALRFLDALRSDHGMRLELDKLGPNVTEDDLLALGRSTGFDIDVDQLRRAHALDWRMRQARFTARFPD
jgi:hypothetical protein